MDGADCQRPLDVVDLFELVGHLTELLGAHVGAQAGQLDPQAGAFDLVGLGQRGFHRFDPGVLGRAGRDVTGEHDGRGRRTPITDENEPSTAMTSMLLFRTLEKTTKEPP